MKTKKKVDIDKLDQLQHRRDSERRELYNALVGHDNDDLLKLMVTCELDKLIQQFSGVIDHMDGLIDLLQEKRALFNKFLKVAQTFDKRGIYSRCKTKEYGRITFGFFVQWFQHEGFELRQKLHGINLLGQIGYLNSSVPYASSLATYREGIAYSERRKARQQKLSELKGDRIERGQTT